MLSCSGFFLFDRSLADNITRTPMDLFKANSQATKSAKPLAHDMRPETLEDFVGQKCLTENNNEFLNAINRDKIPSIILWGPPGTGKTSLANVIAKKTNSVFEHLQGGHSGAKEIKEIAQKAIDNHKYYNKNTILFIDEIHRFNKTQQDLLLPFVEKGEITLIGATTENPSFSINPALLSRLQVLIFDSLKVTDLEKILVNALNEKLTITLTNKTINLIAKAAAGDARFALQILEKLNEHFINSKSISENDVEKFLNNKAKVKGFNRTGDDRYILISAFIKSMRDNDVQASLYYLAKMIHEGEDPLFIVRRMTIFASEDIGLADPWALNLAINVKNAVEFVGMPEARIILSQACVYFANSPKSNSSYLAINKALELVKQNPSLSTPMHLRNAPNNYLKSIGYGQNYKYSHNYKNNETTNENLPEKIKHQVFYSPKSSGFEKKY